MGINHEMINYAPDNERGGPKQMSLEEAFGVINNPHIGNKDPIMQRAAKTILEAGIGGPVVCEKNNIVFNGKSAIEICGRIILEHGLIK